MNSPPLSKSTLHQFALFWAKYVTLVKKSNCYLLIFINNEPIYFIEKIVILEHLQQVVDEINHLNINVCEFQSKHWKI